MPKIILIVASFLMFGCSEDYNRVMISRIGASDSYLITDSSHFIIVDTKKGMVNDFSKSTTSEKGSFTELP
jgi:hypothetical protein